VTFSATARRLGLLSATVTVILLLAYAVTLTVGLLSLKSPNEPIGNPMFSILEILIIVMMPALVALMVAVHAWAPTAAKSLTLMSVIFMGLLASVTCGLHFVILTLSHQPAFAEQPWQPLVLSFTWPSVAYALDILGWDVFFAIAMFFAAPAFGGSRLSNWIRGLMVASGILSVAGLSGPIFANMQLRNIGIVGYVGVFLVVAVLLTVFFHWARPEDTTTGR
jgi:hypothetical protein